MLSPLKLSVIVCGAAAGLAVAPYFVKQVLPPEPLAGSTVARQADEPEVAAATVSADSSARIDLPVAAPAPSVLPAEPAAIMPVAAVPTPAKAAPAVVASPTPAAELQLAAPALPSPALPVPGVLDSDPGLTLPSLSSPEVASVPAVTPAPTKTPPPRPSPTPEIPYRSDVEAAQKLMKDLGINTGKIDGKLGPNTQAAVRKFQKDNGLSETGEITEEVIVAMEKAVAAAAKPEAESKVTVTDAKAVESSKEIKDADDPAVVIVRKSDSKPSAPKVDPGPVPTLQNMKDVRKLQEQLKLAGTYTGEVDGKWGDLTRAAMREFQEKAGIEVTGRPNRETWLAMHAEKVRPDGGSDEARDSVAVAESGGGDELPISSVDSAPSRPVVVNVNGDGVSDPDSVRPIATPKSVSSFDSDDDGDGGSGDKEEASAKGSVSRRDVEESEESSDSGSSPSDLAVAAGDREEQMEKLRRELESRRVQIQTVGNEYDAKKYAPKTLETVHTMMDEFKIETVSNNPDRAMEQLERIDKEIERTKNESRRKKASEAVEEVRESYDELKKHFPNRIKSLSLSNDDEKALREDLTELVAKVDLGFEAMEKDFKAGNYDPLFENCKDFRETIDAINSRLAEAHTEARLKESATKKKLAKSKLEEIEKLHASQDHISAADLLDKELSSDKKS